jgi:hypothetical protein
MAKFLKENFDKKETFDFGKWNTSICEAKKHVKNTSIPVFTGILMAVYRYSVFAISIHCKTTAIFCRIAQFLYYSLNYHIKKLNFCYSNLKKCCGNCQNCRRQLLRSTAIFNAIAVD